MVQAIDEMEQRDLPQAFRLLGEMNANVLQVNQLVDNMLVRVKNGEVSTDKGLSFLEMKYHMLLSYLINLTYVVLRKCSGERIEGDPSIDRLVEIRTVLEKIRPIDHKLKYQIDKLVKTAVTGTTNSDDPSSFKANPDALIGKIEASDEESDSEQEESAEGGKSMHAKKSGVYVPPKLAAVHYDGDETNAERLRKAGERARRRAVSGAVLRELREEYLDAPTEDAQGVGEKQASLGRENKRKIEYEENYMTRLPVTKQEKHRHRQMTTLGTLGDEITSFGGSSSTSAKKRKAPKGKAKKMEDIVSLIDNVAMQLTTNFYDRTLQMNVVTMCNHLKLYAHQLESIYKDQLDRAFVAIRNGSQDERLDVTTRVYLLELIELRAKQWRHTDSMDTYYCHKLSHIDNHQQGEIIAMTPDTPTNLLASPLMPLASPTAAPILGPGEVIKNSGKFAKPTRIPGKNYCKDEVVIRNSDSGKVMGIKGRRVHMIEELSETIISFQRVNPGAKERLVQITGTSEDKINYAKDLIKDTIQRNASPVRLEQGGGEKGGIGGSSSSLNSSASDESNRLQQHQQQQHHPQASRFRSTLLHSFSTNDASIGEYKYTVTVGNHSLKITGCNLDLVRTAKLVLDEYFSGESEHFASGVEYFSFEEEPVYAPMTPTTPQTPLISGNVNLLDRKLSLDSAATSESEETYKPRPNSKVDAATGAEGKELSYEFLLTCSEGPYAKRAPADWARIVKDHPNIVRKAPISWFEPEAYKARVATAGLVTVLPAGEIDNDPE